MGRIKNMGTATMQFKEGIIVTGSAHNPNGTDSAYALVVSGSAYVDKDIKLKGKLDIITTDVNNDVAIAVGGGNNDTVAMRFGNTDDAFGFNLIYSGSGSGNENTFLISSDGGNNAPNVDILEMDQSGSVKFNEGVTILGSANSDFPSLVVSGSQVISGSGGDVGLGVIINQSDVFAATIKNDQSVNGHVLKLTTDGNNKNSTLLSVEGAAEGEFIIIRGDGRVGLGKTSALANSRLVISGANDNQSDIAISHKLQHLGDSDTYLGFPGLDKMSLYAGSLNFITLEENASTQDALFINQGEQDIDFVVSGQNLINLIFADAANGKVGVGTNTANEKLTVSGSLSLLELDAATIPGHNSNYGKIYTKASDSKLYFKNDSGTEYDLTLGSTTAAGSDTNLLYNNGGAIGGAARLYYDDTNHRLGIGVNASSPSNDLNVAGTVEISNDGSSNANLVTPVTFKMQKRYSNGSMGDTFFKLDHSDGGNNYGLSILNPLGLSGTDDLLLSSSRDMRLDVGDYSSGTSKVHFDKEGTQKGYFDVETDFTLHSRNNLILESSNQLGTSDITLNSYNDIYFKQQGTTALTFDLTSTETKITTQNPLTISNVRAGNYSNDLSLEAENDFIVKSDSSIKIVASGSTQPTIITGGSSVDGSIRTGILAIATSAGAGSYLALDENTVQAKSSAGDSDHLFINSFGSGDVSITNTGNVGIGSSAPAAKLHVSGSFTNQFTLKVQNTTLDSVLLATFVNDNTSTTADGIGISIGPSAQENMTTSNKFIKLRDGDGTDCGFIEATNSGGVDISNAFTGGHPIGIASGNYEVGSIIDASGDMWVKILTNVSDSFPYVNLCRTSNSKKVFGVICCTSWAEGKNPWAGTVARHPIKDGYQLAQCNSVGEGSVIVTNIAGDVANGDYITSSAIAGYGQKQSDDILHNYTVAKCIENIDWNNVTETVTYNGTVYKKYLTSCTYHCG